MKLESTKSPDKSSAKRTPEYLLSLGYNAAQVESILHIAHYVSAFSMEFEGGKIEFFNFLEPKDERTRSQKLKEIKAAHWEAIRGGKV